MGAIALRFYIEGVMMHATQKQYPGRSTMTRLTNWFILKYCYDKKLWEAQVKEHQKGGNASRTIYLNCAEIPVLGPESLSTTRYLEICNQIAEQTGEYLENHLMNEDPIKDHRSPGALSFSESARHCGHFRLENNGSEQNHSVGGTTEQAERCRPDKLQTTQRISA